MKNTGKSIYKAIHEGKWLYIEYKNLEQEISKFWFGIENINIERKVLEGKGLHLKRYTISQNMRIYIDCIMSSKIVDGTYMPVNRLLVEDIRVNPEKFESLFPVSVNLGILSYLADCNKLEGIPALNSNFHLIDQFDDSTAKYNEPFRLSEKQFTQILEKFYRGTYKTEDTERKQTEQLCLNILSIHTPKGLYVLAYRELLFDVENRTLRPDPKIKLNKEFAYSTDKQEKDEKDSITRFIDAEDLYLLENFENNLDEIENLIGARLGKKQAIDDRPYFLCLYRNCNVDLEKEYESIIRMYMGNCVTVPIRAFFGELKSIEQNENPYPITLLNNNINLDQLLSIYNAMNYPVTYIQGPPGTGKTNTIINTIITAFFNEKTVLFSSYNNHPIDTVAKNLSTLEYKRKNGFSETIPFPILRLGNNQKVKEALKYIKDLYLKVKDIPVYPETLMRNKDEKIEQTKRIVELLKCHQEAVDLRERKQTLEALIEKSPNMEFRMVLEGNQLSQIKKRLDEIGTITDKDALALLELEKEDDFRKYLYFKSISYIKRLEEPSFESFMEILLLNDEDRRLILFNKFISNSVNLKLLQKIFPVICTTCISAHKLGDAEPDFDITIIDEASQCNTAVSLIPIIRGKSLMLVGDPQQLNPVITLDPAINKSLKKRYNVSDDYDYISNSIYKSFLANDSVSEEILLHNHYRCAKKIIDFNNKKYYNNQLNLSCKKDAAEPLVFYNVKDTNDNLKNTSEAEAKKIVSYIKENPEKNIGIITPFKNQEELIRYTIKEEGIDENKYPVGTVHAFQGDEKEAILFSLALTGKTHPKTYDWVCNNRELINVATSRAKDKLVLLTDEDVVSKLHNALPDKKEDDLYELVGYIKNNGTYKVSYRENFSRALGTKPYKTETELAFLTTLNHAISNIVTDRKKYKVETEVQISHLFQNNISNSDFFYRGSFDFVIYQIGFRGKEIPVIAIELNGREHYEDEKVKRRDEEKKRICREQGFELIYVQNSYARRYNFIKQILADYFNR